MVRLKIIIPNAGMIKETLLRREKMLSKVTRPDTELSVECIESGPESIESHDDEVLALPSLLKQSEKAEKDGYDAVIVYCGSDPGLEAIRKIISIPVVGPGKLAFQNAADNSPSFSVITPLKETIPIAEEQIIETGIDLSKITSIRSIDIPVSKINPVCDIKEQIEDSGIYKALLSKCKKVVNKDDAKAIVLHCMGMAGFGEIIQKKLNVPLIDPAFLAVRHAETLAISNKSEKPLNNQ